MATRTIRTPLAGALLVLTLISSQSRGDDAKGEAAPAAAVSYDKQIRPIFQARCQGCHQPAKPSGGYVMTAFDRMLAGGKSKAVAIVPKNPEESHLVDQITPDGGEAEMPRGQKPLARGRDRAGQAVDRGRSRRRHRPEHAGPVRHGPSSGLYPAAGDHGARLFTRRQAAGGRRVPRGAPDQRRRRGAARTPGRPGRADRVGPVLARRHPPGGHRRPARTDGRGPGLGRRQAQAAALGPRHLRHGLRRSWSPDGTKIAFGCADNSVRAIDAKTGEQVLFQGSHNDWALDTVFSTDGSHLVSVGRDRAAKLTEVETQRFIDNITSITPGALKGGILAVARHPKRDEIVVGGSDGTPKIYRIFRQSKRVIGDDSNLVRQFPPMPGRVNTVAVSPDGKRIAAGSSSDGTGQVDILNYDFDTDAARKHQGDRE